MTNARLRAKLQLEDPTIFVDQVFFFGCNQRAPHTNERFVEENRNVFESLVSAGVASALPGKGQSCANTTL